MKQFLDQLPTPGVFRNFNEGIFNGSMAAILKAEWTGGTRFTKDDTTAGKSLSFFLILVSDATFPQTSPFYLRAVCLIIQPVLVSVPLLGDFAPTSSPQRWSIFSHGLPTRKDPGRFLPYLMWLYLVRIFYCSQESKAIDLKFSNNGKFYHGCIELWFV